MRRLKKKVSRSCERVAESAGPSVCTKLHRISFAVCKVENHDWQPRRCAAIPVLQYTIDVNIAKSVAAYQDRVCLVEVSHQSSVEGVERLDEQLVKLVSSCNQGGLRQRFSFGPFFGRPTVQVIEERFLLRQIVPPTDRAPVLMLERMMYAAMKVIYEAPSLRLWTFADSNWQVSSKPV